MHLSLLYLIFSLQRQGVLLFIPNEVVLHVILSHYELRFPFLALLHLGLFLDIQHRLLLIWFMKYEEHSIYARMNGLNVYVYDLSDVEDVEDVKDAKDAKDVKDADVYVYYFKDVDDLDVLSVFCVINDEDVLSVSDFNVCFYFCYFNEIEEACGSINVLYDLDYVLASDVICVRAFSSVLETDDVIPLYVVRDDVGENVSFWLLIIGVSRLGFS